MPITGPRPWTGQGGKKSVWILPDSLKVEPLIADLQQTFVLVPAASQNSEAAWFDSFDWRLYDRGLHLLHDGSSWLLLHRDSEEVVASIEDGYPGGRRFVHDFPVSRVRTLLEPLLEMRCLLPLYISQTEADSFRIINPDNKTVAWLFFEQHYFQDRGAALRTVRLQAVRGYAGNFNKVARFFSGYGINDKAGPETVFAAGLKTTGRFPLDYSSKFRLDLNPEMSSRLAMIATYKELLATIQRNESGIVEDLDSEFLHDFRVAIRRTRSGLGLVKQVLPPAASDRFRKGFAWLGAITGPVRDLDVYLLYENNYRGRLPKRLQDSLLPFFDDMQLRRIREQEKLVRHLRSAKYRRIVTEWHDYLYSGDFGEETKNSELPVAELARSIIWNRFHKVMRDGKAIRPSSPAADLHRLRIQCKKLRYILEFFASLYCPQDINPVIKQLRRLQNNLGDFNDLSVQQQMLRGYLDGLRPGSRKHQELAASLGGLLTNLYHQQQRVRSEFGARFHAFARPQNQKHYRELCAR